MALCVLVLMTMINECLLVCLFVLPDTALLQSVCSDNVLLFLIEVLGIGYELSHLYTRTRTHTHTYIIA